MLAISCRWLARLIFKRTTSQSYIHMLQARLAMHIYGNPGKSEAYIDPC